MALLWHVCQGSSSARQQVVAANTEFALQLYKRLADVAMFGEKVCFSPFSVYSALANVYAGANRTTKTQMSEALNLDKVVGNVHEVLRELFNTVNDPTNKYTLQVANGMFAKKGLSFLDTYLSSQCCDTTLKAVDFAGDLDGSRNDINDWAAKKTSQKIKELFEAGAIKTDSVLMVGNAVYFKGVWSIPFDAKHTVSVAFHLSPSRKVLMEMMTLKGKSFRYAANAALDCKIVELPYAGNEVSMYVFLPNAVDGLATLEKALNVDSLTSATSGMSNVNVDVTIPKFKLTGKAKLRSILMSMGMQDLFLADEADLSGIDGRRDLVVSDVVHQAYVDVNEEGTAAGVHVNPVSAGAPVTFKADHPFLFLIREKTSGGVLIMGRLKPPLDEGSDNTSGSGSSAREVEQLSVWLCGLVVVWMLNLHRHIN